MKRQILFSVSRNGICNLAIKDARSLTWFHLIRMTMEEINGQVSLQKLYDLLSQHPKAVKNPHYKERIRATIYEQRDEFIQVGK